MTPAKRRRLFRGVLVLLVAMLAGVAGRFYFLNQSIPSLLMGRKPGSAQPGTLLVRHEPEAAGASFASQTPLPEPPSSKDHPTKLKFDVLGNWKFIEGKTPIPASILQWNGKMVEITGFMMPINETQKITRFIVIQSLWGCCFGQSPEVNHIVVVTMDPGKTVEFYPDPIRVIGRFSVGETREEGYLVSIYQLTASKVIVK